ncbi:hypothetical protein NUH88_15880 [Nisaea acidiphila]|uniref:Uncharacterized protein n=1 Tax=Nisaea acidiphila TaxID=1862145 RepID=A0A9J7APN4_9PROT|nr:hypothetical protein [Nisaea acidiphila]UUX48874.1 hypothetical protein NUH88_15880 [Nisaea acidiphila]
MVSREKLLEVAREAAKRSSGSRKRASGPKVFVASQLQDVKDMYDILGSWPAVAEELRKLGICWSTGKFSGSDLRSLVSQIESGNPPRPQPAGRDQLVAACHRDAPNDIPAESPSIGESQKKAPAVPKGEVELDLSGLFEVRAK